MFRRILRLFRRRPPRRWVDELDQPPGAGVREPRRPRPAAPGGAVTLDPPDVDER